MQTSVLFDINFTMLRQQTDSAHTIKVHKGSFRYGGFDAGVSVENNGVGVLFLDTYKYKSVDGKKMADAQWSATIVDKKQSSTGAV